MNVVKLTISVLLLAVVVAYSLHLISNSKSTRVGENKNMQPPAAATTDTVAESAAQMDIPVLYADTSNAAKFKHKNIVHVNTDTILEKVAYFKNLRLEFERKSQKAENELAAKMRVFENDYIDVQKRVQAGQVNEAQLQELQKQLMQQEMELSKYKESQTLRLMEEERNFNKKITSTLQEFFKSYAKANKLNYILGYTTGSGILYANDSLDITQDVLRQLNKQLANQK